MDVPLYFKHDDARVVRPLAVTPAYEAIATELAETPRLQEKLADSVAAGQWARNYMENEVVKREPLGTVFPLGLYLAKCNTRSVTARWGFGPSTALHTGGI